MANILFFFILLDLDFVVRAHLFKSKKSLLLCSEGLNNIKHNVTGGPVS